MSDKLYMRKEDARMELPDLPDCQPPADDMDEEQSWQKMNRGKLSKKQRRSNGR